MIEKTILCPDCDEQYIDAKRFEVFGKCTSCYRRETLARTKNISYVKYKDLPSDEKARLEHQRELNNLSAKRRRDAAKGIVQTKQKQTKNNIQNNSNNIVKNATIRKNQIYTPDIIEHLKTIANDKLSVTELLELLKSLYPDKPFKMSNFTNIIARHNIPHLTQRGRRAVQKQVDEIENDIINTGSETLFTTPIVNEICESLDVRTDVVVPVDVEPENETIVATPILKHTVYDGEPSRFGPIRAEIDEILDTRFRRLNCKVERDYHTDDYLNMVDMLIYLKENASDIIQKRRNQHNIMNAFQSDTIHEFENVIAEDGNTYLSDKMHIIRKYRRHYDTDGKDVNALKQVLETIDLEALKKAQTLLMKNKDILENVVFKPLIDTSMIEKYEWAKPLDLSSAKSRISVVNYNPHAFNADTKPVTRIGLPPNTPPTNQLNAKTRKSLKRFRVSCKVSGGGYGAFAPWYRDYECNNEATALAYAKNTLTQLAHNRKGMIWTDLSCVQLNIDNTPATVVEKTTTPS